MDLKRFLSESATSSLVNAIRAASANAEAGGEGTRLAHLADALLAEGSVASRLPDGVAVAARSTLARELLHGEDTANSAGDFTFDLASLVQPALELARDWEADRVSALTLLAAILTVEGLRPPDAARTQEALRAAGLTVQSLMPRAERGQTARTDFTFRSLGFGTDLTAMARAGHWPICPLVGMERELRRLVMLMCAGTDSVVVVGEPGVGKSAVVHGLAWHIEHGTRPLVPPEMEGYSVVSISATDVLAGTGGRGELEERLNQMLAYFRHNPKVVPFFDEIHRLLDTDDPAARTVATALKPPMVNNQFRCVGATTDKEYARFIANDEAMNNRFTQLLLPEPDAEETAAIVNGVIDNLMSPQAVDRGVSVPTDAVRTAVRLTGRYRRNDCQPRKSIRLLRSALAEKTYGLLTTDGKLDPSLAPADVVRTFSDLSGIPVDELDEEREDFVQALGQRISARVIGQDAAVAEVVRQLSLQAKGWLDPRRPRGRFLFLGPPGVGKTELALALAEEVMRDRGSLVVRNMAEYKGEGARSRFMGSDPGYVGFRQISTIYSEVLMRPYSVVVLDEFEKAHPSLGELLISVLDGSAADSQGRTTDFSQCLFVLTSNEIDAVTDNAPVNEQTLRGRLLDKGGIWTGPLVDRIDRIALFEPLSPEALLRILDGMVQHRRATARRGFPPELDASEERARIVGWAMEGDIAGSARRLERALMRWLDETAGG